MTDSFTVSALRKAAAVTDEQIDAAVRAYLADPETGAFDLADGVTLDLSEAIRSHPAAAKAFDDPERRMPSGARCRARRSCSRGQTEREGAGDRAPKAGLR